MAYTQNVPLGSAVNFAILAGSGITFAGAVNSSNVTGDIGTFPTATITGIGNVVLNGTNHAGDSVTQQAKLDLTVAYLDAAGRVVTGTIPTELGGTTVLPGVYDSAAGDFQITGTLTLDGGGDPNSVWIFKAASTFITAPGSFMELTNGAQACNVFFQVGSSATLDTTSATVGNILALTSITMNTGATLDGRALARNGATTLDEADVTVNVCAGQEGAMPICTTESLTVNTIFGGHGFNSRQYEAALIYLKVLQLAANGGTDYTTTLTTTLIADAQALVGRMDVNQRRIARLQIAWNNAAAAGAAMPADANALNALTACCFQNENVDFDAILMLLECVLGVNAPYPQ